MINQHHVMAALEEKRDAFVAFANTRREQRLSLDAAIEAEVRMLSAADIDRRLAETEFPGARPTIEYDEADALFCRSFGREWSDHQAARAWALQVLENRITIAVDGSQITPSGDFFPPVGATQIGWFVNEHCRDGRYVKQLEFNILSPDELADTSDESSDGEESYAVQTVNQVRFVRECRRLEQLMQQHAALPEGERPVCFFDGSFIISFAGKISRPRAAEYVAAVERLLRCSAQLRVPLVGFVDTSRSRDIVTMVSTVLRTGAALQLNDGDLLAPRLARWGDRSPLFITARHDGLSSTGQADFYETVTFCYMRLNRDRPPARVELPRWLLDAGRAEEVLDIVRAECVVGTGYPYAIETADALAVISAPDRQRFYALFQEFAARADIHFRQTRKASSKQHRR